LRTKKLLLCRGAYSQQRTNNPLEPRAAEVWREVVLAERQNLYPSAEWVEELMRRHPEDGQMGRPGILAAHERESGDAQAKTSVVRFADTRAEPEEIEESELELAVAGCAEKN
jgi:hypothetical protein